MDWELGLLQDEVKEVKSLAVGTSRALRDIQAALKSAAPRRLTDSATQTLVRLAVCELLREGRMTAGGPRLAETATDVAEKRYGHDRAVLDAVTKAATVPLATTSVGAGAELQQSRAVADFLAEDSPSAFAQLSQRCLTVAPSSSVKVPTRTATLSGSWIAEGASKPVFSFTLVPLTLSPSKLSVISVWSEELSRASTPNIERLVADVLRHDLGGLLDQTLLDSTASSSVRPAGLWNGATAVTASALTPASEAMMADLGALAAAVSSGAPDASVTFIAHPKQAVRLKAAGFGEDVVISGYQAVNSVGCVDANSIVMMIGDIAFKSSISAAIHMSDTPLPLGSTGSPTRSPRH